MPKAKAPPFEPPPPPPKVTLQVKCISWKSMDFRIEVQLPYLSPAELSEIIKARHGDPIGTLSLYGDDPGAPENKLDAAAEEGGLPSATVYYDYSPPIDPFMNRPTGHEVYSTNPLLKTTCTEEYEGAEDGRWKTTVPVEVIGGVRAWSKTHERDPHTQRLLDEEAARIAAEEKARAEAEAAEAARIAAEKEAARLAKEEAARLKKEAEAKRKAEEEAERAAAEAEKLRKLEEEAMKDPKKQAELLAKKKEAEAAAKRKEAEDALAALPKRQKGQAIGLFLGNTTREYYGLLDVTEEVPYLLIDKEKILAEIKDKGKIADLYNYQDQVKAFNGEDGLIMICKDEAEVYGDNGFVLVLTETEKQHFIANIAMGNGLPPEMK